MLSAFWRPTRVLPLELEPPLLLWVELLPAAETPLELPPEEEAQ